MFKNKKERLKTLAVIGVFGALGIAAAFVATTIYPFVGVVPAVSFTILYAAIALNFIVANSVVDNVKGYFLDRFCKLFNKNHPKANGLYDELTKEREKLNEMLSKYNKLPSKTLEEAAYKGRQFAMLERQKIKYNNLFKTLSEMSKKDVSAFNKYNILNKEFMPVVVKKKAGSENVVVARKPEQKEKVASVVLEKQADKTAKQTVEQEQEVVIQPIGQELMRKLKDNKQTASSKPVAERSVQGGHAELSAENYKNK